MCGRENTLKRAADVAKMLLVVLVFVLVLLVTGCVQPLAQYPVVLANGEELHGAWEQAGDRIAVFRGIPFAAPPVADLRWRAPVANQPRPGPQAANTFAAACMQSSYITDWYAAVAKSFGHESAPVGRPVGVSEDCLYLNVWTPQPEVNAGLPVMIWIHGGSNKGGWSYEPNYIGTRLAARGVVVVTIAYRLGPFGFFSHPVFNNDNGDPVANFGLLDIGFAIRWVAKNASAFGGDPANITLIGESSGAGDISDLIATGGAKDRLYRHAILQSSAAALGQRRSLADEQATGRRLIESLGFTGTVTAEQLRAIPAKELLAASENLLQAHYFDAVVDGLTMPTRPISALRLLDAGRLDVLIGTNADEWYMYINEKANRADILQSIEARAPAFTAALLAQVAQETDIRHALDRIRTAGDTLCLSRYLAARISAAGGRGRVYYFTRQRAGGGGVKLGAYHGAEIPYVFDTHDDWLPTEAIDHELTGVIMDYWTQFARTGDPNLPDRPQWPVYSEQAPMVMELGARIAALRARDSTLCDMLGPGIPDKEKGLQ